MKKIICITAALLIAAGAFASCGQKENDTGTTQETAVINTQKPDPLAEEYYLNTVTQENGDTTTHRTDFIEQNSHGIEVEMISADVKPGNMCRIKVKGEANAVFKIAVYENALNRLETLELENTESDKNGIANWTFVMPEGTKPGAKAVVIKQLNKNENYVTTVIYVK